jgi:hypothetical protein
MLTTLHSAQTRCARVKAPRRCAREFEKERYDIDYYEYVHTFPL